MSVIKCFLCPNTLTTEDDVLKEHHGYTTALCGECCHERSITPEIAQKVMNLDKRFGNPVSIWEATPPEMFRFMWDAAWTGLDGEENDEAREWQAARRVVHALNVMWFGSEILIR